MSAKSGGLVKGINLTGLGEFSRKDLDELTDFVKIYGAKGMAWVKIKEGGEWQSPIAKFFSDEERAAMMDAMKLNVGDVAVFVADSPKVTHAALGNLRKHVAKLRGLAKSDEYEFCWVTDFRSLSWTKTRAGTSQRTIHSPLHCQRTVTGS